MVPSTQKLIHTFGALADLGQEVANTGDFSEMVRTSMHLLLGTLALRRGAVVECSAETAPECIAVWVLTNNAGQFEIRQEEEVELLELRWPAFLQSESFVHRHRAYLGRGH